MVKWCQFDEGTLDSKGLLSSVERVGKNKNTAWLWEGGLAEIFKPVFNYSCAHEVGAGAVVGVFSRCLRRVRKNISLYLFVYLFISPFPHLSGERLVDG